MIEPAAAKPKHNLRLVTSDVYVDSPGQHACALRRACNLIVPLVSATSEGHDMEQRLRLVGGSRYEKRIEDRHPIAVPGQILWKDAKGATRMASVVTRDVSSHGVSVD